MKGILKIGAFFLVLVIVKSELYCGKDNCYKIFELTKYFSFNSLFRFLAKHLKLISENNIGNYPKNIIQILTEIKTLPKR